MRARAISLALAAALVARIAGADNKAACIAANESGQKLRDEHQLIRARAQFLACSRDACPGVIKKDCIDAMVDLERRLPSVVVRAKDQKGEDLVLVQVDIDGARVAESLDGKGVTLDPGVHDVHLATVGQDPIDVRIVLAEGERERPVIVTFGKPAAATPRAPDDAKRGAPFGAFVVGGAGLLAVGVGAIFYGVGLGERSSAIASGCATTAACDAAKDSVRAKLVVGDLFAGIGVAAVVTGAVWAIVHYASAPAPKAGLSVDAGPVEGGARASVRGVF